MSIPPPYSKNVPLNSKIVFQFDEPIRIEEGAIYISPMVRGFRWNVKGKTLTVTPVSWEENKTYFITIGTGLSDRMMNRISKPIEFLFSTGATIDTGSICGYVFEPDFSPSSGAIVGLYPIDTLNPVDSIPPLYFTITNTRGYFRLSGIPQKSFVPFAFKDANRSGRPEFSSELIGYPSRMISAGENMNFVLEPRNYNSVKSGAWIDRFEAELELENPVIFVPFKSPDSRAYLYISPESNKKIRVALKDSVQDTLYEVNVYGIINENFTRQNLFYKLTRENNEKIKDQRLFSVAPEYTSRGIALRVSFFHPVRHPRFELRKGTKNIAITKIDTLDFVRFILWAEHEISPGDSLVVRATPERFPFEMDSVGSEEAIFIPDETQFGELRITFQKPLSEPNIFLLLVGTGKKEAARVEKARMNFKYFPVGRYKIFGFIDMDGSGCYSAGGEGWWAEELFYQEGDIVVKYGWATEITINFAPYEDK